MCFKRKKEKREWVYILDGCQVRVVFAPKVLRQERRFACRSKRGRRVLSWRSKLLTPARSATPLSS